ncbi:hypothetical protein [Bacillus sp. FJAT-22090]|uniref:hypothetical protein n=1 Tax=Bacillus sp. FJAT-22090 TaxID=1581038 RepID=UPI0011A7A618|nr:hypothetical protein [Bacillus sp. FJAT-22090]
MKKLNYNELVYKEKYYIDLKEVKAVNTNGSLSVILKGSENETNLLVSNDVDVIHLIFPSYATYSVTFEDYEYHDYDEVFDGTAFRIYKYSSLLKHLKRRANLDQQQINRKKEYQHYSLACMEHHLDVVSFDIPLVRFKKFGG